MSIPAHTGHTKVRICLVLRVIHPIAQYVMGLKAAFNVHQVFGFILIWKIGLLCVHRIALMVTMKPLYLMFLLVQHAPPIAYNVHQNRHVNYATIPAWAITINVLLDAQVGFTQIKIEDVNYVKKDAPYVSIKTNAFNALVTTLLKVIHVMMGAKILNILSKMDQVRRFVWVVQRIAFNVLVLDLVSSVRRDMFCRFNPQKSSFVRVNVIKVISMIKIMDFALVVLLIVIFARVQRFAKIAVFLLNYTNLTVWLNVL